MLNALEGDRQRDGRFKAGNKKLEDEPRSGRPTAMSFDELENLAEQHPYESVRYLLSVLAVRREQWSAISRNGEKARSRRFDWLNTIVTGDEKWALYINHTHKCAWCAGDEMPDPFVEGEIHAKKVMRHLEEKRYDDRDHPENDLQAFFASKSPEFYAKRNRGLVNITASSAYLKSTKRRADGSKTSVLNCSSHSVSTAMLNGKDRAVD
ncbi:hypothetical protein RB195_019618 [Necator americanus]|uniref:Transposase n=1 Tax=Necator americanus TaxID=51031 RepID=A0ABR1CF05_NECAM